MKTQIALLSLLIFLTINSCAQTKEKETEKEAAPAPAEELQVPEELKKDKVVIYNSSNENVTFFLGESVDNLEKFKLNPKRSKISSSFTKEPFFIIYTTNEVFSKYSLELGEEYKIYYNEENKKWDLTHLVIDDS